MRHAWILAAALAASTAAHAAPSSYRYDPVHSQIIFSVTHNGFSRSLGRLHVASGTLLFDDKDWTRSSTDLTIDLSKVDMGDAGWSKAVRGNDFFASDRAATARYVSTSVEKRSDNEGVIHGNLTLRGVTRPVDVSFRLNRVARTIYGMHTIAGFSGTATLDRTAFGMTSHTGSIGTDVAVMLEIEAIRTDDTPASASPTQETPRGATQ
ncbi:polyisoprenoid-binding protein YceI [Luteibacter sp. Sphag1AF]|uniref:YceI family protein n=1 Tax=Luteibacter sp. Sphag1AF TaxID=2587031 RepID=UPI0017B1A295|nr:YceI family protein [Luteibacter sp. Sphag1AF]MBB3225801.1 polyisoprenoid-binding protein YceI [Luteibacter sp. Sphag1AF]